MATWRDDKILELANQLTYSPADKRSEQLAAATALLHDIDPQKSYPWDLVHFRITGFQPLSHSDHPLPAPTPTPAGPTPPPAPAPLSGPSKTSPANPPSPPRPSNAGEKTASSPCATS